ncbi:glycosyltransferase, partial [Candidatus Saccharibacteria bacterium]|nr:glycosyltransferase [Candidatus Saccharibacteria bacterium]
MTQKHIVIEARNMPTSTGRYVEMLVRYLEKIDTVNRYSVLMYPDKMDKWVPSNPNFTAVPCPYKEYSFSEQVGLKQQLDALKPDLVHFSMPQQPVLYRGKVVTTIQDLTTARFRNPDKNAVVFWVKQQVYKWLIKYVSHKSVQLIAISDFTRHDIAEYAGVSVDKITVTHEAADDFDQPAQEIESLVGKQFIMGDGRARPHKNLRRQIQAFAILHEAYPDLYFLLTGKQDKAIEEYKRMIEELGLSDRIVIAGFIPDGQLKWAMAHCQAF